MEALELTTLVAIGPAAAVGFFLGCGINKLSKLSDEQVTLEVKLWDIRHLLAAAWAALTYKSGLEPPIDLVVGAAMGATAGLAGFVAGIILRLLVWFIVAPFRNYRK